jgi:hypothetical protein
VLCSWRSGRTLNKLASVCTAVCSVLALLVTDILLHLGVVLLTHGVMKTRPRSPVDNEENGRMCLYIDPVWHNSASPIELFFRKQLHEQLHERGRAMFLQLHRVLNSVRESFQRSWPESWTESWLFGYWSCEAAREVAHEAVPDGPMHIIWIRWIIIRYSSSFFRPIFFWTLFGTRSMFEIHMHTNFT